MRFLCVRRVNKQLFILLVAVGTVIRKSTRTIANCYVWVFCVGYLKHFGILLAL